MELSKVENTVSDYITSIYKAQGPCYHADRGKDRKNMYSIQSKNRGDGHGDKVKNCKKDMS